MGGVGVGEELEVGLGRGSDFTLGLYVGTKTNLRHRRRGREAKGGRGGDGSEGGKRGVGRADRREIVLAYECSLSMTR